MSDTYEPSADIWEVDAQLEYNEALESGDARYVPTASGRGDFSFARILKALGVDGRNDAEWILRQPHPRGYHLFCGHRGFGKSTELRRVATKLHHKKAFFVVFMDVLEELDYNNLQYADVLLTLANQLFEQLEAAQLRIDQVLLQNLEDWFKEWVETNERVKDFAAEVRTGAKADSGIPFLGSLFAEISTALKTNSTYKQELRNVVENSFAQFASSFNLCLLAAEQAIQRTDKGQKLLFIVDGTDRLRGEDSHRFFISDVHQLKQIEANFIYCAPIYLLYEGNQVQQEFRCHVLPMIKLHEKGNSDRLAAGYAVMTQMIAKRISPQLFADTSLIDQLITYSGGSPRELLKLLHYSFLRIEGEQFDNAAIEAAIYDLAVDYKRVLDAEDYALLYEIDNSGKQIARKSPRIQHYLYQQILFEYDGFWLESHPVIRTLPAYQQFNEKPELLQQFTAKSEFFSTEKETFAPPIKALKLSNFTVFAKANIQFSPQLNIIIGENSTGKTHLLKIIYSMITAFEKNALRDNLKQKLLNVFRTEKLPHLIRHNETTCRIQLDFLDTSLEFGLTENESLHITALPDPLITQFPVYFPTRELLSIFPNFVAVYENHYLEFDETWRDTCILLGRLAKRKISPETQKILDKLGSFMGGQIILDDNGRFYLRTPINTIEMHLLAEGLRKLGMLAQLLTTGCLNDKGYLFWDEPEANLNPRLLKHVAQIILDLCQNGVQVFIATHSLFLLRELEILTSSDYQGIKSRFMGLHLQQANLQGTVNIEQGDSIDDIGELAVLDEQLLQSDRYMDLNDYGE